jgi:hypothetical protein
MRDGAGIGGWNGSRKPWNLGSLLIKKGNHKSFGLFLAKVRCKLLNRRMIERRLSMLLRGIARKAVTLVILCNSNPKFNLDASQALPRDGSRRQGKSFV